MAGRQTETSGRPSTGSRPEAIDSSGSGFLETVPPITSSPTISLAKLEKEYLDCVSKNPSSIELLPGFPTSRLTMGEFIAMRQRDYASARGVVPPQDLKTLAAKYVEEGSFGQYRVLTGKRALEEQERRREELLGLNDGVSDGMARVVDFDSGRLTKPKKKLKKRKLKKKKKRRVTEDAETVNSFTMPQIIKAALRQVVNHCSSGRSAQDDKLWADADYLRNYTDLASALMLFFRLGMRHGSNQSVRLLRNNIVDPNSYSGFCRRCGVHWNDHSTDDGCACLDKPSFVKENLPDLVPGL